jgi:F0F1-type ATP synthase membrane subunit c/vacuolar-type H+-ATPase subunit K
MAAVALAAGLALAGCSSMMGGSHASSARAASETPPGTTSTAPTVTGQNSSSTPAPAPTPK